MENNESSLFISYYYFNEVITVFKYSKVNYGEFVQVKQIIEKRKKKKKTIRKEEEEEEKYDTKR